MRFALETHIFINFNSLSSKITKAILKDSCKNIEKWLINRKFVGIDSAIVANWGNARFVHFLWSYPPYSIAISLDIELLVIENILFRLTFLLKVVSFKNIDIWLNYGPKTIKFGARAHIWACGVLPITQAFFPIWMKLHIPFK